MISSIDKPMSPAGEAANDFISLIKNKSQEERLEFRTRVKETKVRDLKEMVTKLKMQKQEISNLKIGMIL